MWIIQTLAIFSIQLIIVNSYGTGAPSTACVSMQPGHGSQPNQVSPYALNVSASKYTPGGTLTVKVNGGDYQGIILQARVVGSNTIVGSFQAPPANTNTKVTQCSSASDTLTHSSPATKTASVIYTWQSPSSNVGNIEFIATVAQQKNTWWKNVKSSPLVADPDAPTANPAEATTTDSSAANLNMDTFSILLVVGSLVAAKGFFNRI